MQFKIHTVESEDNIDDNEQAINCYYYNTDEFKKAKFKSSQSFSILHLNIHSIQLHIEELKILLELLEFKFDIIAISESKLNDQPITDITINGYHKPYIKLTEANKGGTLLYVKKELNFKPREDLEIYKSKELESSFIEIINSKETNDIVGVIYRHPNMDTQNFIDDKLNSLLNKLSFENNKKIYIAGDFNFDLLKASNHTVTLNFINKMTSNFLLPVITLPTKINKTNDTLIDNIFTNQINPDIISGNLTVDISDHIPSFMIIPRPNQNHLPKKHNIYTRDTKNFDKEKFFLDLLAIDWDETIDENDANKSFNQFLNQVNSIIDKYMPLKKISNKEFKRKFKPWITKGILKSIQRKNELFRKYIKCKNETTRNANHQEYKELKNLLNVTIKNSKKNYYKQYFSNNSSNLRQLWIGIKDIINIKSKSNDVPSCLQVGNNVITETKEICNSFNDYFSNIAEEILKKRKYDGNKSYDEFLNNPMHNSFFYEPCTSQEVNLLITELNITKATGPNGIPTRILHQIKLKFVNH